MTPHNNHWPLFQRNHAKIFLLLSFAALVAVSFLSGCYPDKSAGIFGETSGRSADSLVAPLPHIDSTQLHDPDSMVLSWFNWSTVPSAGSGVVAGHADTIGRASLGMFGLSYDPSRFDSIKHRLNRFTTEVDRITHHVFGLPIAPRQSPAAPRSDGDF